MSECIEWGSGDEIDRAAQALIAKEAWIQITANYIADQWTLTNRKLEPDMARDGVRVAALWRDGFEAMMSTDPAASDDVMKQRIEDAKQQAFGLTETQYRYHTGMLSIRLTMVACDAFCLSFGERAGEVSQLLDWPMQEYGITFAAQ